MFSALSSLIWGEQEVPDTTVEVKNQLIDEHLEVENEWIYIQPKGILLIILWKLWFRFYSLGILTLLFFFFEIHLPRNSL